MRKYVSETIDFLKIDVEGAERDVLLGADFRTWRPRVVVVEATEPGARTPNFEGWEPLLLEQNYLFASFDGLNRYYVRSEDRDLIGELQVPVSCFDEAVRHEFCETLNRKMVELANLNNELTNRNNELAELTGRLGDIYRSRWFRCATKYWAAKSLLKRLSRKALRLSGVARTR